MYDRQKILEDQHRIMRELPNDKDARMRFLENFMELVEEETEKFLEHEQKVEREKKEAGIE